MFTQNPSRIPPLAYVLAKRIELTRLWTVLPERCTKDAAPSGRGSSSVTSRARRCTMTADKLPWHSVPAKCRARPVASTAAATTTAGTPPYKSVGAPLVRCPQMGSNIGVCFSGGTAGAVPPNGVKLCYLFFGPRPAPRQDQPLLFVFRLGQIPCRRLVYRVVVSRWLDLGSSLFARASGLPTEKRGQAPGPHCVAKTVARELGREPVADFPPPRRVGVKALSAVGALEKGGKTTARELGSEAIPFFLRSADSVGGSDFL